MPIRILIADDQSIVRRGLTMFLQTDLDLHIVEEANSEYEAITKTLSYHPDLVVMDFLKPGMDGVATISAIRDKSPDTRIITLSNNTDRAIVTGSIVAGASAYLHKGSKPNQLLSTVKGVAEGRVMLSQALINRVLIELPVPLTSTSLTSEQTTLLRLLAAGHSDSEIALQIHSDIPFVRLAVQEIQTRLSSNSRLLTVLRAMQLGLIERLPSS